MGVVVTGLHILVHVGALGLPVQHADFLPLVDEGRALLEEHGGGECLAALFPIVFAAVAGDDAGMVVVFQVEHIPRPTCQFLLPRGKGVLHAVEGELGGEIVGKETVGALALELDHHVQLTLFFVNIFEGPLRPYQGGFGESEAVVVVEHVTLELGEVFMDMWAVVIAGHALIDGEEVVIGQALFFGDVGDDILAEAVHPHVQPKAEDFLHLLADEGIIHVEVGLLHGEEVEVILPTHFIECPRLALKIAVPVVGELPIFTGAPPNVVVGVGFDALAALLKPVMLVAGVVHHQVHHQFHPPLMAALQHFLEGLHAAELGVDVHIIGDVVAAVCPGGGVDGGEPNAVTA